MSFLFSEPNVQVRGPSAAEYSGLRGPQNAFEKIRSVVLALDELTNKTTSLCKTKIFAAIPNQREVSNNGSLRREYSFEEIDAMLEIAKRNPRVLLLLTLLREVGLRAGAIQHLTYGAVMDHHHTPHHVARVPEKGRTWRCFVTSPNLKKQLKSYSASIFDRLPENFAQAYLFNIDDFTQPMSSGWIRHILRSIASEAGITEVRVHAHAFRHTIVGQLISAGNSMEAVSKFMGHACIQTTSNKYYKPTIEKLYEELKNPFNGSLPAEVETAEKAQERIQAMQGRLSCAKRMLAHQQSVFKTAASQNLSAAEALDIFYSQTPDLEAILRGLATTDTSYASVTSA